MLQATTPGESAATLVRSGVPAVQQLRQVLLWPLRLMPLPDGDPRARQRPWQWVAESGGAWHELVHAYDGTSAGFHERHYNEFVTFLPYVQRFLYGDGRAGHAGGDAGAAPMRVLRRRDIAQARVVTTPGAEPVVLEVVHLDLHFFHDIDVVILNLELGAGALTLPQAQDLLYRLGRGYPAGWDEQGHALHCLHSFEWLDAQGRVLCASDAQQREAFIAHVCERRAPRFAAHWAHVLQPLVPDLSDQPGTLRYRQIEYYRMPTMAYLAIDDPQALTRSDFVRLGLVTGAGTSEATLPYGEDHLADFEQRFCYDRFWSAAGAAPHTRYLCSGHSLVVVGTADSTFYRCRDRGVLAQFRHQHLLLFLIAHFQKAALLNFSDRLAEALKNLDVGDPASVRRFKRTIRQAFEGFLRFTHRYWFHEISEQAQVRALFHLCSRHLGIDALYDEVKDRIAEMNSYLDADSLRRQANTVVRLTVVTIFGLIGTVTTGFLGMNLIAEADAPMSRRIALFGLVFVPTTFLTFYTMVKSKRLSDFLDALSDERLSAFTKLKALVAVWRRPED